MAPVFPILHLAIAQVQPATARLANIGAMAPVLLIILIAIQPAAHIIAEIMLPKHHVKALGADGANQIPRRTAMARATRLLANQIL